MKYLYAILVYIIYLIGKCIKKDSMVIDGESVVKSKIEENKVEKHVEDDPDGGLSFDKFNKKCLIIFFVILLNTTGCFLCPDNQVIVRLPVYTFPSRPHLENISGAELGSGREKIKANFEALIQWGENLEIILKSYNEYANRNNSLSE